MSLSLKVCSQKKKIFVSVQSFYVLTYYFKFVLLFNHKLSIYNNFFCHDFNYNFLYGLCFFSIKLSHMPLYVVDMRNWILWLILCLAWPLQSFCKILNKEEKLDLWRKRFNLDGNQDHILVAISHWRKIRLEDSLNFPQESTSEATSNPYV